MNLSEIAGFFRRKCAGKGAERRKTGRQKEKTAFFELRRNFFRKKFKNSFDIANSSEYSIIRKSRTIGSRTETINLSSIGDTTKKTINKTIAIGAAFTAAVILAPATTFARDHHEPPTNGIRLAADIVNLVRAVIEPRPAPVIVEPTPTVVEKTIVVEKPVVVASTQKVVTTTPPGTIIVTGAEEVGIPEFSYVLYEDEYIPYYEDWLYVEDEWYWVGTGTPPITPPRWTPPPRHRDFKPHRVIVLPEHHRGHLPLPLVRRHDEPRHAPVTVVRRDGPRREPVVVRREEPRREPVVVRREEPRREVARTEKKDAKPARTAVVRTEKKETKPARTAVVRTEKKETKPAEPQKQGKGAPPAKKR